MRVFRLNWFVGTAAVAFLSVSAAAQETNDPYGRLEAQIAAQQAELDKLRAELRALKAQAEPRPVAPSGLALDAKAAPESVAIIEAAVNDPAKGVVGTPPNGDIDGAPPGRPALVPGVTPQLEFGNNSKATLTASFPFPRTRIVPKNEPITWARPVQRFVSISIKTDLTDGVGSVFDRRDRTDRRDLDFLSGTSLTIGYDRLTFAKFDPAKAVSDARAAAIIACKDERAQKQSRGEAVDVIDPCTEALIYGWATETKDDPSTPSGKAYKRPDHAKAIVNAPYEPKTIGKLSTGWGFSVTFSDPQFSYRPGAVIQTVNADGKTVLQPDRNVALGTAIPEDRVQWELEAHGLFYVPISQDRPNTTFWPPTDLVIVPQVRHQSITEFRPGTKAQICDQTAGSAFTTNSCTDFQIERALRRELTTLSLEGRVGFANLPFFAKAGIAPRISHTFQSEQTFLDLPLYLSDKSGKLSGGVRLRLGRGGEDVLGNPLDDFEEIALYFTPLKFDAFK